MQKKVALTFGLILCSAFLAACTTAKPDTVSENQEPIIVDTLPTASSTAITYTLGDVQSHARSTDCWTAIDGKIYDLSLYINKHPGGNAIISACGVDASELFIKKHPDKKPMLEGFYLGELIK